VDIIRVIGVLCGGLCIIAGVIILLAVLLKWDGIYEPPPDSFLWSSGGKFLVGASFAIIGLTFIFYGYLALTIRVE